MATISNIIETANPDFYTVGITYQWHVQNLSGITQLDALVTAKTATTITISFDDSLLPSGVTAFTDCNLFNPHPVLESCCDVTFYTADSFGAMASPGGLAAAGVPVNLPLGDNIIRIGPNPQTPLETWQYDSQGGDPQDLANWYRTDILPSAGTGIAAVESDTTLTGNGTLATPLSVVQQVGDTVTITGTGALLDPFVAAPLTVSSGASVDPLLATSTETVSLGDSLHLWSAGGLNLTVTPGSAVVSIEPANITSDATTEGAPVANPTDVSRPAVHFASDGLYHWDPVGVTWDKLPGNGYVSALEEPSGDPSPDSPIHFTKDGSGVNEICIWDDTPAHGIVIGGDSLTESNTFRTDFVSGIRALNADLMTTEWIASKGGRTIALQLETLQSGTQDQDIINGEVYLTNLGVNDWNRPIGDVTSDIDDTIAYVLGVNPNIDIVWVSPYAVLALETTVGISAGAAAIDAYLQTLGTITRLDWAGHSAGLGDAPHYTTSVPVDGVHMYGNETVYSQYILGEITALVNALPVVPDWVCTTPRMPKCPGAPPNVSAGFTGYDANLDNASFLASTAGYFGENVTVEWTSTIDGVAQAVGNFPIYSIAIPDLWHSITATATATDACGAKSSDSITITRPAHRSSTLYVSESGNDALAAASESTIGVTLEKQWDPNLPFATVAAALAASGPGDTIVLMTNGDYTWVGGTISEDKNFRIEQGAIFRITGFVTQDNNCHVSIKGDTVIHSQGWIVGTNATAQTTERIVVDIDLFSSPGNVGYGYLVRSTVDTHFTFKNIQTAGQSVVVAGSAGRAAGSARAFVEFGRCVATAADIPASAVDTGVPWKVIDGGEIWLNGQYCESNSACIALTGNATTGRIHVMSGDYVGNAVSVIQVLNNQNDLEIASGVTFRNRTGSASTPIIGLHATGSTLTDVHIHTVSHHNFGASVAGVTIQSGAFDATLTE